MISELAAILLVVSASSRSLSPISTAPAESSTTTSVGEGAVLPTATKTARGFASRGGPVAIAVPASVAKALSTTHHGLKEERLKGAAGGVRVDLQGRFQSAIVAVKGPDGHLTVQCRAAAPASASAAPEREP